MPKGTTTFAVHLATKGTMSEDYTSASCLTGPCCARRHDGKLDIAQRCRRWPAQRRDFIDPDINDRHHVSLIAAQALVISAVRRDADNQKHMIAASAFLDAYSANLRAAWLSPCCPADSARRFLWWLDPAFDKDPGHEATAPWRFIILDAAAFNLLPPSDD